MNDSRRQPVAAASIAVVRGGKVLLVRRGGEGPWAGAWSLPGGKVESGETAREAALRELYEETGVRAEADGPVEVTDVRPRDGEGAEAAHYRISVFAGRWLGGEPRAASDAADAAWWGLDELDGLPMTPGTAGVIRRIAGRMRGG